LKKGAKTQSQILGWCKGTDLPEVSKNEGRSSNRQGHLSATIGTAKRRAALQSKKKPSGTHEG